MNEKTNVMRILDRNKITYKSYSYSNKEAISGKEVAKALKVNPNRVFKTLVTISKSKNYYVFAIPVEKELNLKKAAKSVGEKSIEMLKSKDLLQLTGYIHGGCSLIGMKKFFCTTIDISAENYETFIFSAGKIGHQIEMNLKDLSKLIKYQLMDVVD